MYFLSLNKNVKWFSAVTPVGGQGHRRSDGEGLGCLEKFNSVGSIYPGLIIRLRSLRDCWYVNRGTGIALDI